MPKDVSQVAQDTLPTLYLTTAPTPASPSVLQILTIMLKMMSVCSTVPVAPMLTLQLEKGNVLRYVPLDCSVILFLGGACLHVLWDIGLRMSRIVVCRYVYRGAMLII